MNTTQWLGIFIVFGCIVLAIVIVAWSSQRNPRKGEVMARVESNPKIRALMRLPERERSADDDWRLGQACLEAGDDLPFETQARCAAPWLEKGTKASGEDEAAARWEHIAEMWEQVGSGSEQALDWDFAQRAWKKAAALAHDGIERERRREQADRARREAQRLERTVGW